MPGQKELSEAIDRMNLERELMEKERKSQEIKMEKKFDRNYKIRAEIREWITLAIAVTALALSIISIIWQAPLH